MGGKPSDGASDWQRGAAAGWRAAGRPARHATEGLRAMPTPRMHRVRATPHVPMPCPPSSPSAPPTCRPPGGKSGGRAPIVAIGATRAWNQAMRAAGVGWSSTCGRRGTARCARWRNDRSTHGWPPWLWPAAPRPVPHAAAARERPAGRRPPPGPHRHGAGLWHGSQGVGQAGGLQPRRGQQLLGRQRQEGVEERQAEGAGACGVEWIEIRCQQGGFERRKGTSGSGRGNLHGVR